MSIVRFSDDQDRVVVSDETPPTVLQVIDQRPRVVVEQDIVRVITVGTQGPEGPSFPLLGTQGDVLFNGGTSYAVDTTEFSYSAAQRTLLVRKISGTVLDGGNF